MKTFAVTAFLALLLNAAIGQVASVGLPPQPTRSQSGQFLCYGVPGANGPPIRPFYLRSNTALVDLEPWVLVVSCERIKQALGRELNVTTPGNGKIFIFLYRAQSPDDSVVITPQRFADGWNYRVDLPNLIDRDRYLSVLTHVLLLEMANRRASEHTAEIPIWLRDGLAQQLLLSRGIELIPPPPQWTVNGVTTTTVTVNERKTNSLARAHDVMRASPALTFDELSWPSDEDWQGGRGVQFRSSAQLFVVRLLNLKNGRASLRALIESLPQYYNWQFAFLNAFQNYFQSPLDVEKWWAVNVVQFTGSDLAQTWPSQESWQRLDETIQPTVEVRAATNQLPFYDRVTLQAVVRDWSAAQQTGVLQQTIRDLALIRTRLARGLGELADNYRLALAEYLRMRDGHENFYAKSRPEIRRAMLIRRTLKTLDALDSKRAALRPKAKPFTNVKTEPLPNMAP
ncbi:MAG TPA: hypothetical protein VIJ24_00450 [Verrucomicrobiae bacterium]